MTPDPTSVPVAAPPVRPIGVRVATWLLAIDALSSLTVSAIMVVTVPGLGIAPEVAFARPEAVAVVESVFRLMLVVALAVLAVEVLAIVHLYRGRNWARVVLTVLGLFSIGSYLMGIGDPAPPITASVLTTASAVTSILSCILFAVAVVILYLPSANAWFRTSGRLHSGRH